MVNCRVPIDCNQVPILVPSFSDFRGKILGVVIQGCVHNPFIDSNDNSIVTSSVLGYIHISSPETHLQCIRAMG